VVCTCAGAGLLHTALVSDIGLEKFEYLREHKGSGHHFTHIFVVFVEMHGYQMVKYGKYRNCVCLSSKANVHALCVDLTFVTDRTKRVKQWSRSRL
jgi:hypothetical protein